MLYGLVVYEEQLTGSLPYEFDITWLHGSSPQNRISCEMLPPTSKAHRGRVSFISPARKSSGSELSKELEKNSHWLCCPFFLYFPTLNCLLWLTPLGYTTDYSLSILATDEKHCLLQKKKKNSIQLHGCMQGPHSSHTHYWGVCSFFDTHVYRQGWMPVRMDHVKSTMSTKIIICAFSSKSFLPKSINLDALIYNKSITS